MICHKREGLQNPLRLHAAICPNGDWFCIAAERHQQLLSSVKYMNVRRCMIIGVNHYPKTALTKDRRHVGMLMEPPGQSEVAEDFRRYRAKSSYEKGAARPRQSRGSLRDLQPPRRLYGISGCGRSPDRTTREAPGLAPVRGQEARAQEFRFFLSVLSLGGI